MIHNTSIAVTHSDRMSKSKITAPPAGQKKKPPGVTGNTASELCGVTNPVYWDSLVCIHAMDYTFLFQLHCDPTKQSLPVPNGDTVSWKATIMGFKCVANFPAYFSRYCQGVRSIGFADNVVPRLLDNWDILTRDVRGQSGMEKRGSLFCDFSDLKTPYKQTGVRNERKDIFKTDPTEETNMNLMNTWNISTSCQFKNLDEFTLSPTMILSQETKDVGYLPGYIGPRENFTKDWYVFTRN